MSFARYKQPEESGDGTPIEERKTTITGEADTQHYPGFKPQYGNPIKPHVIAAVDQTRNNIDRGGYSHGIEQLDLPGLHKDQVEPASYSDPLPPAHEYQRKYKVVTYTWQAPITVGNPVRILPQDPDRVRAVLYVDVADLTVFVTSLHGGPQSDYGFPIVPGGEYFWVYGQNQLWGSLPSGAAAGSRVFVLAERRLPIE